MSLLTATTVEEVKRLIELRHDVNQTNRQGKSALHPACENGNLDIVKVLCEAGADVNKLCPFCYYPIDYAARAGYLEIVKYLIENYPVIKLDVAVFFASREGHIDVLDYLLTLNLKSAKPVFDLAKPVFDLNSQRNNPLLVACRNGQIDAVDRLLNAGANTNIIDYICEETSMVAATINNRLDIIKRLVVFGSDYRSCYGGKSLIMSCKHSYDDISEFLINLGCDVNCCIYNMTPLIYACRHNNLKNSLKVLKLLLERGANPDFVNCHGKKTIDYCVSDEIRALFIKN